MAAAPAAAITYGVPDGNDHPNVGAIVATNLPGRPPLYIGCSGTLIGADVFLTAGHCIAKLNALIAQYPQIETLVTFDAAVSDTSTFYTLSGWYIHPDYPFAAGYSGKHADPADLAVMILDESPGIAPASLPTAGLLDELKSDHLLGDTVFVAVGYGDTRSSNESGFQSIVDTTERHVGAESYLALTDAFAFMSQNLATGDSGPCYGDSGGPHFLTVDGVETDIIAAVTTGGDAPCVAMGWNYRTDTQSARSFLGSFVALP